MKSKFFVISFCFLCLICTFSLYYCSSQSVFANKKNKPVIVIDPGHGGIDPGKVSATGIQEKKINLEISNYLKDYLIAQDYIVYLTREGDNGLESPGASNKKTSDLKNRTLFFEEKKADLVISIHQNSYSDSLQHGAQTFYYALSSDGEKLAKMIQTDLTQWDSTNTRNAASSDSYYILKHSSAPAVLIECGFLSNPDETARLTDSNYQKEIAYTITLSICRYFNQINTQ